MFVYQGVSLSAQANSPPIVIGGSGAIQYGQFPTNPTALSALGLVCTVSSGASLTYSVQITCDPPSAITNWNDHDVLTGKTASASSNIIYPVTAIRLAVTAYSSGSVNLGIAQWP